MLKRAFLCASVVATASFACSLQAGEVHDAIDQGTNYIGVSGGNYTYENSENGSADLKAISLVGGHFIADRWAIEVEAGTGFEDDAIDSFNNVSPGTAVNLELDQYFSSYLMRHFSTGEKSSIYIKGGVSRVSMTAMSDGLSRDEDFSENGLSYGIGLQAHPSNKMGITLEYGQIADKGEIQLDALTIGISSRF